MKHIRAHGIGEMERLPVEATRTLQTFARRINRVLVSAGWPECPYAGMSDDVKRRTTTISSSVSVTTQREGGAWYAMTVTRRDRAMRIEIESRRNHRAPNPEIAARNDLIRNLRRALG